MKNYDHNKIEKKWQKIWKEKKLYKTAEAKGKKKFYVLDMFPYPSGEGLHVGHPRGYIGTDIYSRFKKMEGFNILHPMGFDSFGLPAEQFAIKHKIHPEAAVKKNIKRYKEQLGILGFNYDWDREVVTSDPAYYKWTQWIFLKLYEKGLAYESFEPINWCPQCQTGLANEDLEHGHCERCGTAVVKKPMRQWVLKITKYADRLLKDLNSLNWPESVKESQRNWIGRSEGAEIEFKLLAQKSSIGSIKVFTTRPDTLFGVTYVVLAPEHALIDKIKDQITNWPEVEKYIKEVKNKTEIERTDLSKAKTGVELKGIRAINPANNEEVPVWLADYVLANYGTGAVMAVPAHDERDFEFANNFGLPVKQVVFQKDFAELPYLGDGEIINSAEFEGIGSPLARQKITEKYGTKKVSYKLKDWVFSRQRYWGEPIPIIHCLTCGVVPVPEKDLPVTLPKVKHYEPTGTGESPLAGISKWINVKCPKCKGPGKRETNTMPSWAGSSWYYLRFIDPKNKKSLVDLKKEKYWMAPALQSLGGGGVDLYVGGTEHATRHLIYARFWHKFLYDMKVVNYKEPFMRLQNQGLIMASDGRKMSKRWGNVVNPDDIAKTYGADTLRIYEMFMGPFDQPVAWNTDSIMGARRFLEKVWRIGYSVARGFSGEQNESSARGRKPSGDSVDKILHKTIKKVSQDIENMSFNTAVSSMMILATEMEKAPHVEIESYKKFLQILAPFAPHITEEIWAMLGEKKSIYLSVWPKYDPRKIKDSSIKIAIQVNGKVRTEIEVSAEAEEAEVRNLVLKNDTISGWISGKEIKRFIYIKNKLVSIVI